MKIINIFLSISALLFVGCNSSQSKEFEVIRQSENTSADSLQIRTAALKDTFQQDKTDDKLKPIRENSQRINSITKWSSTNQEQLDDSGEGGEATFYYSSGGLEKIVARHFGETFQQLTEYYLLEGQLSFVFEKSYKYNRPIYYDSASMKENNDNQAFDMEKSEVSENRSYFKNGKIIHQLHNQDGGSSSEDDYLFNEQIRLKTDFDKLKAMIEKK